MKPFSRHLFSAISTIVVGFLTMPQSAEALHVVLDAGHGGRDRGAVRGSIREADIALNVSRLLAEELRKDGRFRVTLTRDTNKRLSLKKRARIAHQVQGDIFMSIHANASEDQRARGVEFYFQNQLPPDEEVLFLANRENAELGDWEKESETDTADEADIEAGEPADRLSRSSDLHRILEDMHRNWRISASADFSRALLDSWSANLALEDGRRRKRSIHQAPFFLVSNVRMPSILVEMGFVSHPKEGPRLADAEHQKRIAQRLYEGIVKFKETMDKDRAQRLD